MNCPPRPAITNVNTPVTTRAPKMLSPTRRRNADKPRSRSSASIEPAVTVSSLSDKTGSALLRAPPRQSVNDLLNGLLVRALGPVAATLVVEAFVAGQRACRAFQTAFALVYMLVIHAGLSWFESMILIGA